MQQKDPVSLNDSVVEVDGQPLDCERFEFWSDTFRHADLLRYQDGDVQMMITNTDETTTFEITVEADDFPQAVENSWLTGERFSIRVENSYFDLVVENARTVEFSDGLAKIVAEIQWRPLANVSGVR